jgi:hypothetical protein
VSADSEALDQIAVVLRSLVPPERAIELITPVVGAVRPLTLSADAALAAIREAVTATNRAGQPVAWRQRVLDILDRTEVS